MQTYSMLQAAKSLGITDVSLGRYVKAGKIPAPHTVRVGNRNVYVWTEPEIENVRKLLPKIANGRKTRYQKLRAKTKTQPRAAVPHKPKPTKKKRPRRTD